MIFRLGLDTVDLGRATEVTVLGAKKTQTDELTATGKAYTVTWNYYTGKGWKFSYSWLAESILGELSVFHSDIAEAKKNVFEIDLDNGETELNCRFLSNPLTIGKQQMRIVSGVWQPTYDQVSFDIEQVA